MAGSIGQPTQGWLPWMGHKSAVGVTTRDNVSILGMGSIRTAGNQNDEIVWPVYLDSGTWKVCLVHRKANDQGIVTVLFDGASLGTVDFYNSSTTDNNYSEITSISITTPKVADLTLRMATKNASSIAYGGLFNSIALIKTAGAHSTGAGTDTPGYTWMYLPWMGSKANTNFNSRTQSSVQLGGGQLMNVTTGTQNDLVSWDIWLDAGTYKYAQIYQKENFMGIYHVRLDGVDQGTIDAYAATSSNNNYSEITGIVIPTAGVKNFELKMASKNASSTGYYGYVGSVAWIRTS